MLLTFCIRKVGAFSFLQCFLEQSENLVPHAKIGVAQGQMNRLRNVLLEAELDR